MKGLLIVPLLGAIVCLAALAPIRAQGTLPDRFEEEAANSPDAAAASRRAAQADPAASPPPAQSSAVAGATADEIAAANQLDLLSLLERGGPLMIPIYIMSIIALTFTIERFLNLRREKIMPRGLLEGLGQLSVVPAGFDPRKAYRLTQQYPSPTASVIRAMLLKVGRPHTELEHAVSEASQREGLRMFANVRWLHFAVAVAPLFGLFGTVWGMIEAFFDFSNLTAGTNKATFLAEGIYVALVTTFGGLAVAIPTAVAAYFFEGRIESMVHQIDELMFSLIPHVERYEGRLRVTRQSLHSDELGDIEPTGPAVPEPALARERARNSPTEFVDKPHTRGH